MPTSKRWKNLKQEIETLRQHFLPQPFDPLGNYPFPDRVQAHTRGFLVLCHAEIETYLEEWAKEIALKSRQVWTSAGRVTTPFAFLLVTQDERLKIPVTLLSTAAKDTPQQLSDASVRVFNEFFRQINNNHGIKEKNLLALFAPLGLSAIALGSSLPPRLDYLGDLRGTHAHHSARAVVSVLDPETEYNRVRDVLTDLKPLDEWLINYKRRVR